MITLPITYTARRRNFTSRPKPDIGNNLQHSHDYNEDDYDPYSDLVVCDLDGNDLQCDNNQLDLTTITNYGNNATDPPDSTNEPIYHLPIMKQVYPAY